MHKPLTDEFFCIDKEKICNYNKDYKTYSMYKGKCVLLRQEWEYDKF